MSMFESWKQVHAVNVNQPAADDKKVVVRPLPSPARVPYVQPHAKPASKKAARKVDDPLPPFTTPTAQDVNMFFHRCKSTSSTTLATEDHDAGTQATGTVCDTLLDANPTLPDHDGSACVAKQEPVCNAPAEQQADAPDATLAPAAAAPTCAQVVEAATMLPTMPKEVVGLVHPNFRKKHDVVLAACKPVFATFVADLRAARDDDGFRFGEDASEIPALLEEWAQRQLDMTHADTSTAVQTSLMRPDTKDLDAGSRPELQPAVNMPCETKSPEANAVAAPAQQESKAPAPAVAPEACAAPAAPATTQQEPGSGQQNDNADGAREEALHA